MFLVCLERTEKERERERDRGTPSARQLKCPIGLLAFDVVLALLFFSVLCALLHAETSTVSEVLELDTSATGLDIVEPACRWPCS